VALAQYREKFWFPSGALAANIPARVFLHDNNVFAPLYTDATGTTPLPNPLRTDAQGYLTFWAEEGTYWLHIDTESFEIFVGGSGETATEGWVLQRIAEHNADTTDVHGIPDTSALLTQADLDGYVTDAEFAAHVADTTDVHGISNTADLETKAGAQAKADAAEQDAITAAGIDATAKANLAEANATETAANALAAHAADTTNVHGIADTSALLTEANLDGYVTDAELAAHAADTTNVHGITDTSQLATDADVAAVSASLADHVADTTGVHGIANTADLLTQADLENYATDAELAAHAADTTAVHGIANTADLLTQADIAGLATEAQVQAVQNNLNTHAATTTNVHGIPDTSVLVTDADLAGYATQAEVAAVQGNLTAHADATTNVHGIPDTSLLLTQADIDGLATEAQVQAVQANLTAHATATTNVHGIPDTAQLATQADLTGLATDADVANVQNQLTAHATATTNVHGIADTSVLETQAGAQAKANAAQAAAISAAAADATTKANAAQANAIAAAATDATNKANTAQANAIADAATKYLNRLTGGNVSGTVRGVAPAATGVAFAAQVDADTFDRFRILVTGELQWGSGAAAREITVARTATGELTLTGTLRGIVAAATTLGYGVRVTGETSDRFTINGDGSMGWGPGTAGADVHLRRAGVNLLQLDDNLAVLGTTTLTGQLSLANQLLQTRAAAANPVHDVRVTGDTQPRFYQVATGQMYWGSGSATLDTVLYRDQPGSLVTDGNFTVNGQIYGQLATVTTNTGVTAPSGFTVATQNMWNKGGVRCVAIGINLTAALTLPGGTSGNITPDLLIATVPAAMRPPVDLYLTASTGIGHGSIRVQANDGQCQLLTWIPGQSIANGSTIRFTYTCIA
jgi:hypothetical protein